ncbi:MAG: right-handed parallel beta-helix repeat-containing protein [Bacteroidales bacterium]|nr:right-handed parallel beta-helix repeat-containing protein [Bacteroidales bacterium]
MKKITLFIALAAITLSANAKVLRVSNVAGSSAPYTNYYDAQNDAVDGDTIMFDGSNTIHYPSDTMFINKKVVVMGPGYWLDKNNQTKENASSAKFHVVSLVAEGAQIVGLEIERGLKIDAPKTVVKRCYIYSGSGLYDNVKLMGNANNVIISQNYIIGGIFIDGNKHKEGIFITNNIIEHTTYSGISGLANSTIANNTFACYLNDRVVTNNMKGCIIENNIGGIFNSSSNSACTYNNNYQVPNDNLISPKSGELASDKQVYDIETMLSNGIYGAFAGEDPYVLSGVPAGPVIEDVEVPASVAKGKELNVTVKIGISK